MQSPITFSSVDQSQNLNSNGKSALNATPPATPFHQVLNKEISHQNTNAPNQTNNNKNTSNNPNADSTQNEKAPTINTNATSTDGSTPKTDKARADDDTSADVTATATLSAQDNNTQFIAFVANLSQFVADANTDSGKLDGSNTALPTIMATADASLLPLNTPKADELKAEVDGNAEAPLNAAITDLQTKAVSADQRAQVAEVGSADQLANKANIAANSPGFKNLLVDAEKNSKPTLAITEKKQSLAPSDNDKNELKKLKIDSSLLAADRANAVDKKSDEIKSSIDIKNVVAEITSEKNNTSAVQNFAQQLGISSRQVNTNAVVEHLAPNVGSPAWDQAVGQKVVWMVAGGQQTAELTLNPPDLGPMHIVLSVNNDQANATFIAAQPEVRDALESAMPRLRQMMSDAGVQLTGFSVNSQAANQNNNAFAGTENRHSKSAGNRKENNVEAIPIRSGAINISQKLGLVDTFV